MADLPKGKLLTAHRMVASPGKDIVFSFGGWDTRKELIKFGCHDDLIQHCQWRRVGTLTYDRKSTVAMAIPDDLANKLC